VSAAYGSRSGRTHGAAVVLAGASLLLGAHALSPVAPHAWADRITVDDPPAFTAEQLADGITPLDTGISELQPHTSALVPNIEPFETRSTEGTQTVVTLASDILFAYGESTIDDHARTTIGETVADAPQGAAVAVHGHTDSQGDEAFNLTLSEARAQTVADAIAATRPDLRLDVQGFGESQPVSPNETAGEDDPAGRAENRRVEIRYGG
jgi:outer membrane protein OmpA-like peptidoglycan-associated protein